MKVIVNLIVWFLMMALVHFTILASVWFVSLDDSWSVWSWSATGRLTYLMFMMAVGIGVATAVIAEDGKA